jgi:ubiquitin carboxyl-terminal hydrolase 22/27/51
MQPFVETTPDTDPLPSSLFDYDLFAVVTHEGGLNDGHYWADVLSGGEWYKCDDDKGANANISTNT